MLLIRGIAVMILFIVIIIMFSVLGWPILNVTELIFLPRVIFQTVNFTHRTLLKRKLFMAVRFEITVVTIMKMDVFSDTAPCSLVDADNFIIKVWLYGPLKRRHLQLHSRRYASDLVTFNKLLI
jgi:hypothetical protein